MSLVNKIINLYIVQSYPFFPFYGVDFLHAVQESFAKIMKMFFYVFPLKVFLSDIYI